jgi:hypothetical protein
MSKTIYIVLFVAAIFCNHANAQDSTLFPRGQIGANTDNYTGTIWLNELNHPDSNFTFSLAQAVYAPGAKLDWPFIREGNTYSSQKGKAITRRKASPQGLCRKAISLNVFQV